jgi:phosphatidylserine decarboxylase
MSSITIFLTPNDSPRIHEPFHTQGHKVEKGDEIGYFQFGGSSIVVAFEKGRIQFDEDLEKLSNQQIMVDVEVGMSLGQATNPSGQKPE